MTNVTTSISISHMFRSWVALYQLRLPMASLWRSLYDMPGLAPRLNVLFWGRQDLAISFSNSETSRNAWNRHWRSLLVDTWILSNNTKLLSHLCLRTFCSLTKYNDNPPPIRLYTNPWPFFTELDLYRLMRDFHRTFATGVACPQGTLTPPGTWSRPIWDFHIFYWHGMLGKTGLNNLSISNCKSQKGDGTIFIVG